MNLAPYLGKPWVSGGQGPDCFDCLGLLKAVYLAEFEIDIETFGNRKADDIRACMVLAGRVLETGAWRQVSKPEEGDAVALSKNASIHHVGLYLDGRRILHAMNGQGVIVQRFAALKANGFQTFIYYRHELRASH